MIEEDDCANAVPHGIPSLYTNFYTAATILRLHRSRLEDPGGLLDDFFALLDQIELTLRHSQTSHPFLIVVEGLDGSGKSSLVRNLATALSSRSTQRTVIATRTPPTSVKAVRNVFDRFGGSVARAFYMISNYILQYEIIQSAPPDAIVLVDRFYASTCAYSVARFLTKEHDIRKVNVWDWPFDLIKPHLQLVLSVDHTVRAERTRQRNAANCNEECYNDWDERLARDRNLGDNIQYGLERIQGPRWNITIDANPSAETVLAEALRVIQEKLKSPTLESQLQTQLESHGSPLVALVSNNSESFPSVATAKLLAVQDASIYGVVTGTMPQLGTLLWQQHDNSCWKIQAALEPITRPHLAIMCETDVLNPQCVPFHASCLEMEYSDGNAVSPLTKCQMPDAKWSPNRRPMTIAIFGTHCAGKSTIAKDLAELLNCSFDPELGDVLRGKVVANGHKVGDGSGRVVNDWDTRIYNAEVKRDREHSSFHRVVETWHVGNYGWACVRLNEGSTGGSDGQESLAQRYRKDEKGRLAQRYRAAIEEACQERPVLLINLKVSAETSLRRRQSDNRNRERLPLVDEMKECNSIHEFLQKETSEFVKTINSSPNLKVFEVENDMDGPDGAVATLRSIVAIVDSQRWRSWMVSPPCK